MIPAEAAQALGRERVHPCPALLAGATGLAEHLEVDAAGQGRRDAPEARRDWARLRARPGDQRYAARFGGQQRDGVVWVLRLEACAPELRP